MVTFEECDFDTVGAVRGAKLSGKELRDRRQALGLSVGVLARHFYVLTQSIYRWERGDGPPEGLVSIGADLVLRHLEREQRRNERGK